MFVYPSLSVLPLLLALLKRPGEYQENQRQNEGLPTTGVTQFIPIVPATSQSGLYTPGPGSVHSGMPVTEDLKNLATRYFTRGQASHEAEPLSCS